jgi:hypothetical protein
VGQTTGTAGFVAQGACRINPFVGQEHVCIGHQPFLL